MALILRGQSKCSICKNVLQENEDIVTSTAFITEANDPMWRFSDSGMHKNCFLEWEHKEEFIKKFNYHRASFIAGYGTYQRMEKDGSISVLKTGN